MGIFRLGDGQGWTFLGSPWSEGPDGEMLPPDVKEGVYPWLDSPEVECLAVRSDEAFADFSARFRFRSPEFWGGGGARFLFRVQDSRRFYAFDIPWCGQQIRARHLWAGFVVADGTPLQRYLNFDLIPGLCAKRDSWYEVRIKAKGSRLRAWIDDVLVAEVEDDTYASGRLGLGCITLSKTFQFADLDVEGTRVPADDWPGLVRPADHWITPCPVTDPDTCQGYASLLNGGSGKILLCLSMSNPIGGDARGHVYLRSSDAGRTWSGPEPATLQIHLGVNYVRRDGTWVSVYGNDEPGKIARPWPLYTYQTRDEGRTWQGPHELEMGGAFSDGWTPPAPNQIVRMRDGSLVLHVSSVLQNSSAVGQEIPPMGAIFAMRSEDDGRTWSELVSCESSSQNPGESIQSNTLEADMSSRGRGGGESSFAEVRENVLMGICRPGTDPYMWQRQSNDGGRTWEPSCTAPFQGYCNSFTATASGAVVATTRSPHFSAHLSRDGGLNWDPPVIVDYSIWANQKAVEAEPDVVVVTYMGYCVEPGKADSRIARLKVTNDGLILDH